MPPELATYITHYGYLAIFSLVFLQEIGVPNPVPNEFVLLFAGYLTSINVLSLPLVLLSVVAADFIGTTILFFVFYFFGKAILDKKPKWIPIKVEHIEHLSERIIERNWWGIYVGRLIPYVRGYTSVAAGLIQIRPRIFIITVILSAVTWSGGYALGGHFMGTYWEKIVRDFGGASFAFYAFLTLLLVVVFGLKLKSYLKNRRNNGNGDVSDAV